MRWSKSSLCAVALVIAGDTAAAKLACDVDPSATGCTFYVAYKANPAPADYGPPLAGVKESSTLCTYTLDLATFPVGTFTFKAIALASDPTKNSPESLPKQDARPGTPAVPSGATIVGINPLVTVGETAILTTDDSGNGNVLIAQGPYTVAKAGTGVNISFYVTTADGNLRLGVYDSSGAGGAPGKKLAESGDTRTVSGWNTLLLTGSPTIPAGQIWIAYLPSSSVLAFRKDTSTGGGGSGKYYAYSYGPMPTTFAAGMSSTTSHWSLYMTMNVP